MIDKKLVMPGCGKMVLASASPRRQEIVAALGLPVVIRLADIEEIQMPGEAPNRMAERLAIAKAKGAGPRPGELVIGSDTIVVLDDQALGKPKDANEARQMLTALRGRRHDVISGLALANGTTGMVYSGCERTGVVMREYSDDEMEEYIASGEPFDKAGAYAIQDPVFHPVEEIEGCYVNVVGLPVCRLIQGMRAMGCDTTCLAIENLPAECRECGSIPV